MATVLVPCNVGTWGAVNRSTVRGAVQKQLLAASGCRLRKLENLVRHSNGQLLLFRNDIDSDKSFYKHQNYKRVGSLSPVFSLPQNKVSTRLQEIGDAWVLENEELLRSMPLYLGITSFVAILLNRAFSGIAAIADASSGQSRADVLVLVLSATVLLTGLVWKSIEPKPLIPVVLNGVPCMKLAEDLPAGVAQELNWVWKALQNATQAKALVVAYNNTCVLQVGIAAESEKYPLTPMPVHAGSLMQGQLCQSVKASGKQLYLANLALYPGRYELPFLPANTQAVIVQPVGDDGVLIAASDMIRGFGPPDKAWISVVAEKLDSVLGNEFYLEPTKK